MACQWVQVAGRVQYMPGPWGADVPAAGAQFTLPSPGHPGRTVLLAQWAELPGGERLLVGFDEYELRHIERRLRQAGTVSLLVVLLLAWFAGRYITHTVLRPIETIRQSARQIMEGDLDELLLHGSRYSFNACSSGVSARSCHHRGLCGSPRSQPRWDQWIVCPMAGWTTYDPTG